MEQNMPDIDLRLPYRVGCPQLPALPLETEYTRSSDPIWRKHSNSVEGVLSKYKISAAAHFAYRFHKETPAEKHQTWLILPDIDESKNGIDAWQKAARDIRNYLLQQGLDQSVEILDLHAYQGLATKPILSSETELLMIWDNNMFQIATTIIQQGHDLKALDLVHQERRGFDTSIAIVAITAKDADNNKRWQNTVEALQEFLPPSLRVEVRYGTSVLTKGPAGSNNPISLADYSTDIDMGTSCGRSGFDHSGSLGGVIKFQSMEEIFALTNHHVMCGTKTGNHKDLEEILSDGKFITLTDEVAKSKTIMAVCPSDEDNKTFLNIMKGELNNLLEEKDRRLRIRSQNKAHIDVLEMEIQLRNHKIESAEDFKRGFGWVVASSGIRSSPLSETEHLHPSIRKSSETRMPEWLLDWSLIRVADNRKFMGTVEQSNSSPQVPVRQYQSISPHKHYNVAMCGRTSGWTEGILSAAKSVLSDFKPTDQPEANPAVVGWNTTDRDVKSGKKPLKVCYSVLPRDSKTQFFEPGDSGSFVLIDKHANEKAEDNVPDKEKFTIGLGFGGNPAYHVSYMMSMETVIRDIEEVTGKKVEEPSNAEDAPDTKEHLAKD